MQKLKLFGITSILLLGLIVNSTASAATIRCEFIPHATLCNVMLSSKPEEFVKALGKPNAIIKLRNDRIGYTYGNSSSIEKFMLTFRDGHLVEIRSWLSNPNVDFWMDLMDTSDIDFYLNKIKVLKQKRSMIESLDAGITLSDADEFSENRIFQGCPISLFYESSGLGFTVKSGDYESYRSTAVIIPIDQCS